MERRDVNNHHTSRQTRTQTSRGTSKQQSEQQTVSHQHTLPPARQTDLLEQDWFKYHEEKQGLILGF